MGKYKIVVFDLDGTIVDSLVDLAQSTNKGLEKAGLPVHDISAYRQFVGNGRDVLIQKAMGDYAEDESLKNIVRKNFDDEYKIHCNDNTSSYEGCSEMLKGLTEKGIATAVLSNKPDEFVEEILKKIYPEHKFQEAWGNKPEMPRKPDGTALKVMLEKLNFKQAECLYIGDSDVDVFTANNAGVDMIGVEWGFRGREELLSAGAKAVVKTPAGILEYLNEH
jgi:phosphoglycolate phosphatase